MKKIFFILTICCISYLGYAQTYTRVTTVRTPNNSVVPYTGIYSGSDISMSVGQLAALDQELLTLYNGATRIGLPTYKYNCHAYAWHITEGGGNAWIGVGYSWEPLDTAHYVYWTDRSYIEVLESSATKVVYEGNHSAVRIDNNWYQSKWGNGPLVKHHPNNVPNEYMPLSTKHYYIRNPLEISGKDLPPLNWNETYSVPTILPTGVTFNGWSVPSSGCTVTGGTNGRTLTIRFSTVGPHTITANFTLPGNIPFPVTKTFNLNVNHVLNPPTIMPIPYYNPYLVQFFPSGYDQACFWSRPGQTIYLSLLGGGGSYEWYSNWPPTSYRGASYTITPEWDTASLWWVRCKEFSGNKESPAGEIYIYVSDSPPPTYMSAAMMDSLVTVSNRRLLLQ